jgi:hypothetical protein
MFRRREITAKGRAMAIQFVVSAVLKAPAKKIYDAWLNSEGARPDDGRHGKGQR